MPDIHALAGAYVLDAVDALEQAAFARHVARCAVCRLESDELRLTVARFADVTWSEPSARVRADVLARIAATPQQRPAGRHGSRGRATWWRKWWR